MYNLEFLCADIGVYDWLKCRTVCGVTKGIGFVIIEQASKKKISEV